MCSFKAVSEESAVAVLPMSQSPDPTSRFTGFSQSDPANLHKNPVWTQL